jgi:hypothetical protein
MDDKTVIRWLWDYGYFWDPVLAPVLTYDGVKDLKLTDDTVVCALTSCQEFNVDRLNFLTETLYSEPAQITGIAGEATKRLMGLPRCPLPDYPPPKNATFSYNNADLQKAVLRMQAVGSGSWPMPCQKEGVTFSVDISRQPETMRNRWPAIKLDIVRDYARLGVRLTEVAFGQKANIRVSWENLDSIGRGVIGLAEFNSEQCQDSVFCKMHPEYYPDDDQIRQLFQHEMGHNMNLPHTQGGIMNPSITDGWVGFTKQDPSIPRLKRFFGGEPVDPPIPPTPVPPNAPKVVITGEQKVTIDGQVIGTFISVPQIPS